ncbi:MAG: hypothetical protein ACRDZY_22250, partial [Acidimicrobiales bacterium]
TAAGGEALRAAAPAHLESVRRHLIDLLTPAEIEVMATIAGKVIDHIADPEFRTDVGSGEGRGADMTEKSPRKASAKKPGKSLKEKRRDKKDKLETRKGLNL